MHGPARARAGFSSASVASPPSCGPTPSLPRRPAPATPRAAGDMRACRYAAVYVEVCAEDEGARRLLAGLFPASTVSTVKPLVLDPPAGVGAPKGRAPEAVASELRGGPVEVVEVGSGVGARNWTWLVESGLLPEEVYYLKARVPFAQVHLCVRACRFVWLHTCAHAYLLRALECAHTHAHTRTHARTHAHTHTHTLIIHTCPRSHVS